MCAEHVTNPIPDRDLHITGLLNDKKVDIESVLSDRENVSDESAFYMFRESPLETVISYPIFCILCFKERRLSAASSPVHSLLS